MPKASLVTVSTPLRAHLLANGSYIAPIAKSALLEVVPDRYALKVLPVDLPDRPWPVAIVTLKNRTLSPVVERFIECARKVANAITVQPRSRKS